MKIQKYANTVSPFSGVSFVNDSFNEVGLSQLIDNELGSRVKYAGYSYSDIIRNPANVFLSGGDVIEDIDTHLGSYLKEIPNNKVPSPDLLNIKSLILTKQLEENKSYDFDYDNQITVNNKYDAKRTYKQSKGYCPGVATIGSAIVYIENRDGNANVKFKQADTLTNAYELLKSQKISINRSRMDAGSYAKDIIEVVAENSKLFYIRANKSDSIFEQIQEIENW